MLPTAWIEALAAEWAARLALHILPDGQLGTASPTEYRFLTPFALGPYLDLVIRENGVAIFARIVNAAALHLYCNNVGRPAVVLTTGLRVEIDATNIWKSRSHCARRKNEDSSNRQQLFVESADLPCSIYKVNLQYPVPLSARSVRQPHLIVVLGVDIKSDLVP